MPSDKRNRSELRLDPQRGDHMNPYGKSRGAWTIRWTVGVLLAVLVIALLTLAA